MSDFITIENLYERCDVLIDANTNQSYYIQMYDEPVLESDNDLIIYQFADEQDFVEITDEGSLPPEYVEYVTTVKADKLAIKHQLKAGNAIPGASLKLGKPTLIIK